ncbi:MAG: hypothetical protein JWQ57_3465 [Mucilaginibacter sp.]|nr:hypothetical protein [Mucilaginibacter sp.]
MGGLWLPIFVFILFVMTYTNSRISRFATSSADPEVSSFLFDIKH